MSEAVVFGVIVGWLCGGSLAATAIIGLAENVVNERRAKLGGVQSVFCFSPREHTSCIILLVLLAPLSITALLLYGLWGARMLPRLTVRGIVVAAGGVRDAYRHVRPAPPKPVTIPTAKVVSK